MAYTSRIDSALRDISAWTSIRVSPAVASTPGPQVEEEEEERLLTKCCLVVSKRGADARNPAPPSSPMLLALATDLRSVWFEETDLADLVRKTKLHSPGLSYTAERDPDVVFALLLSILEGKKEGVTFKRSRPTSSALSSGNLCLKASLDPKSNNLVAFRWQFDLRRLDEPDGLGSASGSGDDRVIGAAEVLGAHLVSPLVYTAAELERRCAELKSVAVKKSLELEELKRKGLISPRRKTPWTEPFDEAQFELSSVERMVKSVASEARAVVAASVVAEDSSAYKFFQTASRELRERDAGDDGAAVCPRSRSTTMSPPPEEFQSLATQLPPLPENFRADSSLPPPPQPPPQPVRHPPTRPRGDEEQARKRQLEELVLGRAVDEDRKAKKKRKVKALVR